MGPSRSGSKANVQAVLRIIVCCLVVVSVSGCKFWENLWDFFSETKLDDQQVEFVLGNSDFYKARQILYWVLADKLHSGIIIGWGTSLQQKVEAQFEHEQKVLRSAAADFFGAALACGTLISL